MSEFRFIVEADSFEEAIAKLIAEHDGDDCPCGLPQFGVGVAVDLVREHGKFDGFLCVCVGDWADYMRDVAYEMRRQNGGQDSE